MALSSGRPDSATGSATRHQAGEKASADSVIPPGALKCPRPSLRTSKLRMAAGTGGVFQGLDGAEKATEDDFVTLDIRVGRPLVARHAVGLFFWPAGLGEGQLCLDGEFEFVQEGVVAGRGTHLSCGREVSECAGRLSCWRPASSPPVRGRGMSG